MFEVGWTPGPTADPMAVKAESRFVPVAPCCAFTDDEAGKTCNNCAEEGPEGMEKKGMLMLVAKFTWPDVYG